jgi:D-glycero-D-manno-heptose 1,7-bisphosphate phosphatase
MKLVILDRDGTINQDSADYVKAPSEWQPLPGALEAIAKLNHAGWHVVVATNQSGLGRGLFDVASLNAMHAKMHTMLAAVGGRIDAVFYCPHAPEDVCRCRKPEPGLFEQIGDRFGVELTIWWPRSPQGASRIWYLPESPSRFATARCQRGTHPTPPCMTI